MTARTESIRIKWKEKEQQQQQQQQQQIDSHHTQEGISHRHKPAGQDKDELSDGK
jgi:hypothetical protein